MIAVTKENVERALDEIDSKGSLAVPRKKKVYDLLLGHPRPTLPT